MRAFWGIGTNVGDTLTPVILEYFTSHKAEWVSSLEDKKLLMCGSILEFAKPGDTVLGAGHYKKERVNLDGVKVLALRGKYSGQAPIYSDPAILLPLIYKPKVKKTRAVRHIPHLWEQKEHIDFIDVNLPWKKFVREILACESVTTSSLHGYIIASVYGVKVTWVQYKSIPGAKFKYEDYLTGVEDRLENAQSNLLKAVVAL